MREALLHELRSAADAAARGTGAIVLLTGEAGIGKTNIARAATRAVGDGWRVTWGNCVADRSAPPFWPWLELVTAPDADVSADAVFGSAAVGAERFAQLNRMRDEILAAARQRPLLHVIEDLQWADVASLRLLAHVGTVVDTAPLLVLATLRTGEPIANALDDALEDVRRSAEVRPVPPLDHDDVAALLHAANVAAAADLAALVCERTGGNALYVTELVRSVRADQPDDRLREQLTGNVPSRVSELIARRLDRLPAPVADLVVHASVLGVAGDTRTLATAHGVSVDDALDLLEQARAARLVETATGARWQFRHALVRDAVYTTLPTAERARLHAGALETALAVGTAPAALLARHAFAAVPLVEPTRAAELAVRAGEAARAHHAHEEALRWFDLALDASSDTPNPARAEWLVLAGEARRHLGDVSTAQQRFLEAADITDDPDLLARAALGYADPGADLGIAYRSNDPVTAELLDRAIAAQPTGTDSVMRVRLQSRLAAELYFSHDRARGQSLIADAMAGAQRLGDQRAMVIAGAVNHDAFVVGQRSLDEQLQGSADLLALARASGSPLAVLTAHRARVFDHLAAGDIAGVDAEILEFRRVLETYGDAPALAWWPALWSAMRTLLEGPLEDAEARATAAFEIGRVSSPTNSFTNLSFQLFFLRRQQGRFGEVEQATRDFVASNPDIPAVRVALIFLLAEIGRLDEARAMLGAIDDKALLALHDRNWPASWFQLARAAERTGNRDLARTLLDTAPSERCVMVSLATVCLGATDRARAWLHATLGDEPTASAFHAAADALDAQLGARGWLRAKASPPPPTAAAVFLRQGAAWEVTFGATTTRLVHSRGLVDLAVLLQRPNEAVSVLVLLGDGADATSSRGPATLDDRARREIRDRMHALDAAIADAESAGDGERAALAREELQQLAEHVARDLGLGGRARRVDDPVERAR
ncbi:MAG TPA: AAA family ATPase, partial [Acidimicrobiales bacterium]|nr:AAA family ATPase [Acidimicrobiales bacterium]